MMPHLFPMMGGFPEKFAVDTIPETLAQMISVLLSRNRHLEDDNKELKSKVDALRGTVDDCRDTSRRLQEERNKLISRVAELERTRRKKKKK